MNYIHDMTRKRYAQVEHAPDPSVMQEARRALKGVEETRQLVQEKTEGKLRWSKIKDWGERQRMTKADLGGGRTVYIIETPFRSGARSERFSNKRYHWYTDPNKDHDLSVDSFTRAKAAVEKALEKGEGRSADYYASNPAAYKKKLKYDTEQNARPKAKGYRAELGRERYKRGLTGKGGKDVSHHKTPGKFSLEDPAKNRARNGADGESTKREAYKGPRVGSYTPGKYVPGEGFRVDGSKVFWKSTKAQIKAAAKAIGWPMNSIEQVHTRFARGWAIGQHAKGLLTKEEYGELYAARNKKSEAERKGDVLMNESVHEAARRAFTEGAGSPRARSMRDILKKIKSRVDDFGTAVWTPTGGEWEDRQLDAETAEVERDLRKLLAQLVKAARRR